MRKVYSLLITLGAFTMGHAQGLSLVSAGKPNSAIILPQNATVIEIQAAKVLQDYIQRISTAVLPILSDKGRPQGNEILIGNTDRPASKRMETSELGKGGFVIRSTGRNLVIAGGAGKGVLYGVYTFLESYLGCRKYSSALAYTPKLSTISLTKPIDDVQRPAFTYREDFYPDAYDPEYLDWHKLDSHYTSPENGNEWGSWVHTADHLLGAKEYGKDHPEYFSYYDGARHAGLLPSGQPEAQLCLTNLDVLDIVCKSVAADTLKNPLALYWSVSQNDNVNYCRDSLCAALDKKYAAFAPQDKMYKTHENLYPALGMGSLLTFINKVADRFPDRVISTLAYQYTRVPPKGIVPRKNVNIMLCNIESPRNVPIDKGDTSFANDLAGWTKLTHNIIIWDYVVQYRSLVSPFPNLKVLQPNLQYLHNQGVQAIFEEGNPETGGEFAELRAYLLAKLLWNPDADVDRIIADFTKGYYGKASPYIGKYIDLLHHSMERSGARLLIYGTPPEEKETFLTDSLIAVYTRLFDQAEKSRFRFAQPAAACQNGPAAALLCHIGNSEGRKNGESGALSLQTIHPGRRY